MKTDPDAQVPKWDAYESYKQFATENRMEVISDSKFTKEMKQQNGVSYRQRRVDGRRTYCYVGVNLTDDAPQPPQDDGDDQDDNEDDGAAPTSLKDY
jgi:putative DNA primase/helicase